jgi:hypothetical protein
VHQVHLRVGSGELQSALNRPAAEFAEIGGDHYTMRQLSTLGIDGQHRDVGEMDDAEQRLTRQPLLDPGVSCQAQHDETGLAERRAPGDRRSDGTHLDRDRPCEASVSSA